METAEFNEYRPDLRERLQKLHSSIFCSNMEEPITLSPEERKDICDFMELFLYD